MKLSILFWCYKELTVCENRLRILRRFNPDTYIYCLYGGDPAFAQSFEDRLGAFIDDFYAFLEVRSTHWKWYHGDRMIAQWFSDRGHALEWDSLIVAQWDMLILDRVEKQFRSIEPGQMLFSGLRPVSEVDPWWWYVRQGSPERKEYERFLEFVWRKFDYKQDPLCGQFLIVCFPRQFLARYVDIPEPELGFLEYKIPIYAQIFGIPFCVRHQHDPWWADHYKSKSIPAVFRGLNAQKQDVPLWVIEAHRAFPWGRRIFHPVTYEYPLRWQKRVHILSSEIYGQRIKSRLLRLQRRLRDGRFLGH